MPAGSIAKLVSLENGDPIIVGGSPVCQFKDQEEINLILIGGKWHVASLDAAKRYSEQFTRYTVTIDYVDPETNTLWLKNPIPAEVKV